VGPPACGAAGDERGVALCGTVGDAEKGRATRIESPLKSGQQDIVREVLGLVGYAAVSAGGLYDGLTNRSKIRHCAGTYHGPRRRVDGFDVFP